VRERPRGVGIDRGQSLSVEWTVFLLVVLLLVFTVVQAGLLWHARSVALAAAQRGANAAAADGGDKAVCERVAKEALAAQRIITTSSAMCSQRYGGTAVAEVRAVVNAEVPSLVWFWEPVVDGQASAVVEPGS
jgi:hypothetical protein